MSLESDMRSALIPVCPRVYPDAATASPAYPLIIYQQVGGRAFDYAEQEVPDKANARVQVWVWAKTRLEASSLSRASRVALVEGPMRARTLNAPVSDYNEALQIYGARTDYEVWYTP